MKITEQNVNDMAMEAYGLVPPLVKQMAMVSPEVAYHYLLGLIAVSEGKFSVVEQHAIQLKVSVLNRCESCIKGHSYLLKNSGVSEDDIAAIRQGVLTSSKAINRILDLTEMMYHGGRDGFTPDLLDRIETASPEKAELFQIVSLIATKTISNYINNYLSAVKSKTPVNQ